MNSLTTKVDSLALKTNSANGVKIPKPVFTKDADSKEYAASLDAADPLREFRDKFIVPSKANLASKKLAKPGMQAHNWRLYCF